MDTAGSTRRKKKGRKAKALNCQGSANEVERKDGTRERKDRKPKAKKQGMGSQERRICGAVGKCKLRPKAQTSTAIIKVERSYQRSSQAQPQRIKAAQAYDGLRLK